ncbi:hypothetical protein LCGC14_3157150, partial [marine sediment metagenome]
MDEKTKLVVRTSKGLQDCLFNEIDDLHSGKATLQSSAAIATLAFRIIQVARLELDAGRSVTEPKDGTDA